MRFIASILSTLAPAILVLAVAPALASMPVRQSQTGCVMMSGEFFNQTGYRLRVLTREGAPVDLSPYMGKRLRLEGWLHPGDRYTLAGPPQVLGPCPIGR